MYVCVYAFNILQRQSAVLMKYSLDSGGGILYYSASVHVKIKVFWYFKPCTFLRYTVISE